MSNSIRALRFVVLTKNEIRLGDFSQYITINLTIIIMPGMAIGV